MPEQPSPRRRFQFRLRTLMIGVTLAAVACCWGAKQLRVVRERSKMLASDDLDIIIYGDGPWSSTISSNRPLYGSKGGIPWYRRLLGDREINTIRTSYEISDQEVEQYWVAFPEADVARSPWKH